MTLPRELALISTKEGIRVKQQPVKEIEKLRGKEKKWKNEVIGNDKEIIHHLGSDTVEILASVEVKNKNNFQIKLGEETSSHYTLIEYNGKGNSVSVDRTLSGTHDFNPSFSAKDEVTLLDNKDTVTFRIFLDRSSIEVFVNDGEESLTYLLFPDSKIENMTLSSSEGDTTVRSLDVYELKGIWK